MRWLIQYIRSCFCTHDWELIFDSYISVDNGETYTARLTVVRNAAIAGDTRAIKIRSK